MWFSHQYSYTESMLTASAFLVKLGGSSCSFVYPNGLINHLAFAAKQLSQSGKVVYLGIP